MLGWLLPAALLLIYLFFLGWYTSGFSAFTMFSRVLSEAGRPPYPAAELHLSCHNGVSFDLREGGPEPLLLNFIYLNCVYGCPISLSKMYRIGREVGGVLLVSVSVDPERDSVEDLRERWSALGGFPNWLFCKPTDRDWRDRVRRMGVWVYKREDGLINHTLDIFVVREGKVIGVFSPEEKVSRIKIFLRRVEDEALHHGYRVWDKRIFR